MSALPPLSPQFDVALARDPAPACFDDTGRPLPLDRLSLENQAILQHEIADRIDTLINDQWFKTNFNPFFAELTNLIGANRLKMHVNIEQGRVTVWTDLQTVDERSGLQTTQRVSQTIACERGITSNNLKVDAYRDETQVGSQRRAAITPEESRENAAVYNWIESDVIRNINTLYNQIVRQPPREPVPINVTGIGGDFTVTPPSAAANPLGQPPFQAQPTAPSQPPRKTPSPRGQNPLARFCPGFCQTSKQTAPPLPTGKAPPPKTQTPPYQLAPLWTRSPTGNPTPAADEHPVFSFPSTPVGPTPTTFPQNPPATSTTSADDEPQMFSPASTPTSPAPQTFPLNQSTTSINPAATALKEQLSQLQLQLDLLRAQQQLNAYQTQQNENLL